MAKSEQLKIAEMQTWRDLALGGMDVITRNPHMGVLATIFAAEGGQRLGWIAPGTKSTLVAGLVTGSIIGSLGNFSQGSGNVFGALPSPVDIVNKVAKRIRKKNDNDDSPGFLSPRTLALPAKKFIEGAAVKRVLDTGPGKLKRAAGKLNPLNIIKAFKRG